MSIADEIRNMNNSFLAAKTQETLKEMPLEKLAEEWYSVDKSLKEGAINADGSLMNETKYKQDKKEIMDKLVQILTPEIFKKKADEYLSSLSKEQYNVADLAKVSALLGDYPTPSEDVKDVIEYTRSGVISKKERVEKPVNLNISNPKLNYTSATIRAHKETVASLSDQKDIAGKTLTFSNKQGENIADTTFHKNGDITISLMDENNKSIMYNITKDGKLMREVGSIGSDDKKAVSMKPVDLDQMSPLDKQAYIMANEAQKIWKDYANGNLDDKIINDNPLTVNEDNENDAVRVNEQSNEIEINQETRQPTKVNELNPLINMIDPTKINEGESPKPDEKKEGDINDGELDQPTKRPDEVYWKEADIIDTMFGWLVDGANAATNFVVHRIEDVACGLWSQLNKDLLRQKEEKEKLANSTQRQQKELVTLHNTKLKHAEKTSSVKNIDKLLEKGDIQSILNGSPAFAVLYEKYPHLQQLMTAEHLADKQNRKNAASIISSTITMVEFTSNKYALASMMDEKIHNKSAFNNDDREAIYNERQKEGVGVFLKAVNKYFDKNKAKAMPEKSNAEIFEETLKQIRDEIQKANDNNSKAIKNDKYDEKNQIPDTNVALFHFQQFAPERSDNRNSRNQQNGNQDPQDLRETVEDSQRRDAENNSRLDNVRQEEDINAGREEDNRRRRDEFDRRTGRDRNGNNGPENNNQENNNQDSRQGQTPFPHGRDGGR